MYQQIIQNGNRKYKRNLHSKKNLKKKTVDEARINWERERERERESTTQYTYIIYTLHGKKIKNFNACATQRCKALEDIYIYIYTHGWLLINERKGTSMKIRREE